jgi:hypothetical protein
MNRAKWFEWRRQRKRSASRTRLQLELLETRNLMSSSLGLTPLVQVSGDSPLDPNIAPNGKAFFNSEVEPQIAVDPTNPAHAVAVWQQDRYRSVGDGRALVASVTYNANDPAGASWSTPAAIPGFNAAVANSAFGRYTDPWVTITPTGGRLCRDYRPHGHRPLPHRHRRAGGPVDRRRQDLVRPEESAREPSRPWFAPCQSGQ